jgi:hypothetical protein
VEELEARALPSTVVAGTEFAVTQQPPLSGNNNFFAPVAALNTQGTAGVVAWEGTTSQFPNPNNNASIWGRLVTLSGPTGRFFRVSTPSALASQQSPSVAMDAAGDFVVVWDQPTNSSGGFEVDAQRFAPGGTPRGLAFQVNLNSTGQQTLARGFGLQEAVAMDASGNFAVVWQDASPTHSGIYVRRFNAAGQSLSGDVLVDFLALRGADAAIAMNFSGNFVVLWEGGGGTGNEINAKSFNASGMALSSPFLVTSNNRSPQHHATVAMDNAGDFVVAWMRFEGSPLVADVFARTFNSGGTALNSEFRVNSTSDMGLSADPTVGMDAGGEFTVCWGVFNASANRKAVFAQRFSLSGAAQGVNFQVNSARLSPGSQSQDLAEDAQGDFLVTYPNQIVNIGDTEEIFARGFVEQTVDPVVPSYAVADFQGNGVWLHTADGWQQLSTAEASTVAVDDHGDVAAVFGNGLWRYAGDAWSLLTPAVPSLLDIAGNGIVVADFAGNGVWRYGDPSSAGGGWQQLTPADAVSVAVDDQADTVASFQGNGVFLYQDASGWQQLSTATATQVSIASSGDAIGALFQDSGVWRYNLQAALGPVGWQHLLSVVPTSLVVGASDAVLCNFSNGVWLYQDTTGWVNLTPVQASQLGIGSTSLVFAEFPGSGVLAFINGGWVQLTAADARLLRGAGG